MIDHRCNGKCVNVTHDIAIGLGYEPLDISITFPVISGNLINNAHNVRIAPYEKQTRLRDRARNSWTRSTMESRPRENACRTALSALYARISRKTRPVMREIVIEILFSVLALCESKSR
ncbi:hypothetical protein ACS0PU_008127 [Formica fusca]